MKFTYEVKMRSLVSHRILACYIISVFLLCFTNMLQASVMPLYERLQPVSYNINAPTAAALDAYGNIYVVESSNNRALIYSPGGDFIKKLLWLEKPISIAVDNNGRIYIGNSGTGNVGVYDNDLNFLFKLGAGNGEFTQPNDIAIGSDSKVYVADSGKDRIKIYNPDGSYNTSFGSSGSGNGQFSKPLSIEINEAAGEIVVLDRQLINDQYGGPIAGARIQVFYMNGVYKRGFSSYGQDVGKMFRPQHVAIDSESRFYVTDSFHNVVLVYDSTGAYLGTVYDLDNPMRTPLGITMGKSNMLFISSLDNARVEVFGIISGADPDITATPESYDFGGVNVLNVSEARTFNVYNKGGSDLLIGSITITGAYASEFSIRNDLCSNQALTSFGSCTVDVIFTPASENIRNANLSIPSNDPEAPDKIILLNGTGINNPPDADPGGPYTGFEGQSITLDGSGSTDPGGNITLYEWDINNDGTYDYSSSSSAQSHTFSQGIYIIKLRVTDNHGLQDEATTTAAISDSSPAADFTGSPTSGAAPLIVNFTNNSTGYDQPLSYAWDFNNDGSIDSTAPNPSYTYTNTGTYTVSLSVTDSDGSVNTLTRNNFITAAPSGCMNLPVTIAGTAQYYSTLQEAYNEALEGDAIMIQSDVITEDINMNSDISLTIAGGYDCNYTSIIGVTTLNGNLTVNDGAVSIENITLQ